MFQKLFSVRVCGLCIGIGCDRRSANETGFLKIESNLGKGNTWVTFPQNRSVIMDDTTGVISE